MKGLNEKQVSSFIIGQFSAHQLVLVLNQITKLFICFKLSLKPKSGCRLFCKNQSMIARASSVRQNQHGGNDRLDTA